MTKEGMNPPPSQSANTAKMVTCLESLCCRQGFSYIYQLASEWGWSQFQLLPKSVVFCALSLHRKRRLATFPFCHLVSDIPTVANLFLQCIMVELYTYTYQGAGELTSVEPNENDLNGVTSNCSPLSSNPITLHHLRTQSKKPVKKYVTLPNFLL